MISKLFIRQGMLYQLYRKSFKVLLKLASTLAPFMRRYNDCVNVRFHNSLISKYAFRLIKYFIKEVELTVIQQILLTLFPKCSCVHQQNLLGQFLYAGSLLSKLFLHSQKQSD